MTHLYLIRHGQAISAVENTIGNTALSPLGIKQVQRLRDRLAATGEIAADVLIASTMLRAKQTAEILAPALGLPIIFDDEVQEWRNGVPRDLQKMTMNDVMHLLDIDSPVRIPWKDIARKPAPGADQARVPTEAE